MPERILVCGDRFWQDIEPIHTRLKLEAPKVVIQGLAKGADLLSQEAAIMLGYKSFLVPFGITKMEDLPVGKFVYGFAARWDMFHRAAGPMRNGWQLKVGEPDLVLAYHNNIFSSKGTKDMLRQALAKGVRCELYTHRYGYQVMSRKDARLKRT